MMKRARFFILFTILIAATSCWMEHSFSDLETAELLTLEQQEFAATEWSTDYGKTSPPSYPDYVSLNAVSASDAGATGGIPDDFQDDIHRLAITNLIDNGDFESSLSGWNSVNGATATRETAPDQTNTREEALFRGNALRFSLQDSSNLLEYDLNASNNVADGLVNEAFYLIRFDFSADNQGVKYFQLQGHSSEFNWAPNLESSATIYSLPNYFTNIDSNFSPETDNVFTIGTLSGGAAMAGYMDNLRMVRTDIDNKIILPVPYRAEGRPDLVSGTYRFSVYIKQVESLPLNEFHAQSVSLGMSATDGGLHLVENHAIYHSDDPGADWSSWTQVTVESYLQIDTPPEDPEDPVVYLTITPTDIQLAQTKDVGSILVAAPQLRYSKDGTF